MLSRVNGAASHMALDFVRTAPAEPYLRSESAFNKQGLAFD